MQLLIKRHYIIVAIYNSCILYQNFYSAPNTVISLQIKQTKVKIRQK